MVGTRAVRALLGELSRRSSPAVLCAVLQPSGPAQDAAGKGLRPAHGNPAELSVDLETGDVQAGSACGPNGLNHTGIWPLARIRVDHAPRTARRDSMIKKPYHHASKRQIA